ncbi:MAG: restriction endonuclease [Gemmatimonadales bacterium]|jgi:hypothetical protein|nr:restriction endonuclease [Gemmatimonadales bacterium]
MPADASLERAVSWFRSQPRMSGRFGAAIRQSFDEVFDGQRTGRYSLAQLSKVEKTYIGTKVEIVIQAEFGLQRGQRMDYLVDGEEVDAKWSIRSGGWMIPTEAVGELCLCMTADDARSTFSVGIVRADDAKLRPGANKDKKRGLNPAGMGAMSWLANPGELAENLLLHLDDDTRSAILDYQLSGQRRVSQLFRHVQHKIVRREVVLTVAQQDDGPKRVRDARKLLQPEGIIVLGHQGDHPRIAEALGLQTPPKGSWIAARVVPTEQSGRGSVEVDEGLWRLATPDDPLTAGPSKYQ